MNTASEIKICELFTVLEDDWRNLYDAAFPANERETESKLAQLIAAGRMLYHKTTGKNGEMLCFSMVSLAPDFSFLAYIATDPNQRSAGVGSKHMKRLLELLKTQYPGTKGLLLEIDATHPKKSTISEDERKIRQRRLGFYRRLGAKKLCTGLQFLGPSRKSGGQDAELDLLIHSFTDEKLDCATKKRLVAEIYQRFYCLDMDEQVVTEVLGHYGDCCGHDADCPEDTSDAPISGAVVGPAPVTSGVPAAPVAVPEPKPEATTPPAEAPVSADKGAGGGGGVDTMVVESECEALEKLGRTVECECQTAVSAVASTTPVTPAVAGRVACTRVPGASTASSDVTAGGAAKDGKEKPAS
ncbi:MAG: hypothetical protein K2W95_22115 [Candidatus Obscuribacterales bacterium]|nr:hypothetical protein [Candidatus Obscuribacterales bacterium]